MSWPSKVILPAVTGSSAVIKRARVDFPQPDSPTRPSVSPRPRSRVMPSNAHSFFLPALGTLKDLRRSRTSSSFSDIDDLFGEVAGGLAVATGEGGPRRCADLA